MDNIALNILIALIGLFLIIGVFAIIKDILKKVCSKQSLEILLFIVFGLLQLCTLLMPIAIVAIAIKLIF